MLPDIEFPCNKWSDLNTLADIEVGTAMYIVGKMPGRELLIWEGETAPAQGRTDGMIGNYGRRVTIMPGSGRIWILDRYPALQGFGKVCVQVAS